MLLLALDTSTAAVTTALHDGRGVLARRTVVDAQRHAEHLAPAVEAVLAEVGAAPGDLTGIVTGVGPGPFTGLRVGVVTARVLGLVLGVDVTGVCSLDALAEGSDPARTGPDFLVATDARRREVYWARYVREPAPDGPARRVDGPHVARPADVPREGLPVLGRGAQLYPEVLGEPVGALEPSAADLAALAVRSPGVLLPADPLYLRRPDAVAPGGRKRVLGPA